MGSIVVSVLHLDGRPLEERQFATLPIRLGRHPMSDFPILQPYISSMHARIEEIDGKICVRDVGSKNGTFLDVAAEEPQRISPQLPVDLEDNDLQFLLGPALKVRVARSENDVDDALARQSRFAGSVIGNPEMLASPGPAAGGELPPLPPLEGQAPSREPSPPGREPAVRAPMQPVSPPVGAAPADQNKATALLQVSPEELALSGLRELANSLVPGVPLETTGDIAWLITKLHDVLDMFCRCFLPLREGYSQFVSKLDLERDALERTRQRSPAYVAVEAARNSAEVRAALLNWRNRSHDPPQAVEKIFVDLMWHQAALLNGLMQGVHALLEELSPQKLEAALPERRWSLPLGLGASRYRELWEAYRQRFDDLSEESQTFAVMFGPEFTQAYRDYRQGHSRGGNG